MSRKVRFRDKIHVIKLIHYNFFKYVKAILSVLILVIAILTILKWNSKQLEGILKDTGLVAILASTLGAITGAFISYFTNLRSLQKQNQIKTALLNKRVIYEPLLGELRDILEAIQDEQRRFIVVKDNNFVNEYHLPYTIWFRIKKDTRYYQLPLYIKNYLLDLEIMIDRYNNVYDSIDEDLMNKFFDVMKHHGYPITDNQYGVGTAIHTSYIFDKEPASTWHIFNSNYKGMPQIDDKDKEAIFNDLDSYISHPSVLNTYTVSRKQLTKSIVECISILETAIMKITDLYDKNNDF